MMKITLGAQCTSPFSSVPLSSVSFRTVPVRSNLQHWRLRGMTVKWVKFFKNCRIRSPKSNYNTRENNSSRKVAKHGKWNNQKNHYLCIKVLLQLLILGAHGNLAVLVLHKYTGKLHIGTFYHTDTKLRTFDKARKSFKQVFVVFVKIWIF